MDCVVAFASRRHRELPIVKILEQAVAAFVHDSRCHAHMLLANQAIMAHQQPIVLEIRKLLPDELTQKDYAEQLTIFEKYIDCLKLDQASAIANALVFVPSVVPPTVKALHAAQQQVQGQLPALYTPPSYMKQTRQTMLSWNDLVDSKLELEKRTANDNPHNKYFPLQKKMRCVYGAFSIHAKSITATGLRYVLMVLTLRLASQNYPTRSMSSPVNKSNSWLINHASS